jgi:hypothetical protein
MARKVTFLLALLVIAVLASSAAAAEPFARHTVRGHGVSLAVPRSWVAADSRVPGPLLERLARENPRLAPFLRQLGRPTSPTKFFAFDPVVRDGFATNVNVVVTPLPSGLGFQDYGAALAAELRSIGARNLRQGVAVVDGERAARLQYRFDLTLGGARLTVQTLQYAFPRSGRSTVVTYTTLPSFAGRYAATFRRSAASIRFS